MTPVIEGARALVRIACQINAIQHSGQEVPPEMWSDLHQTCNQVKGLIDGDTDCLFVLMIEHRHGTDLWVHQTEAGARQSLVAWCREWWNIEMHGRFKEPGAGPENMETWGPAPDDDDKLMATYFEAVEDEHWTIKPCEVQP